MSLPLLAALACAAAPPASPDFDRDVAPILAARCLDCHSGADPKGGLDLSRKKAAAEALAAHRPDDSPLFQRVRDGEMPPKKPLSDREKATLRAWVAAGARWGTDPIDPFRSTTDSRAGYDWWSLRPVVRPAPPAVKSTTWVRNPIDRFVLAKLEAKRLAPSPDADRRTLVRRVTFGLTGLPPSPDEIAAFAEDASPDAYEKLIDRLLSSPAYGERWARHWLDVVRFGESDGFERDLPRFEAWPYRDWVVSAFNANLPYDEFVRLQLAGDALRPGDADALAAAGFLVAGPHDIVVPVAENMRATMRQDELEDVVGTVGQTFLGLTVHCARCHDHKFDPVSAKDYYRMASALSGIGFGERTVRDGGPRLAALARRIEAMNAEVAALEEPVRRELLKAKGATPGPRPFAEWDFTAGLDDRAGKLHAKLHGSARRDASGLRLDGKTAYASTPAVGKALSAKTLEAWVKLDGLGQAGGGVVGVQTADGGLFDSLVFGERQKGHWMAGSNFFRRTRDFGGSAEQDAGKRPVHVALAYAADGTISAYRDGRPYGKPYRAAEVQAFDDKAQVVFGLRHAPAGGNKMLAGTISRARLYDRALSAAEVAASAGMPSVAEADVVARLSDAQKAARRRLLDDAGQLEAERAALSAKAGRKLYTVTPSQPAVTHVLGRGAVTAKGEVVAAEVPAALPLPPTRLKADAPEAGRRLALAKWVTDAKNPLFSRVIVNRLWHYHFGAGLVETTSDLGFNGGRPSHPELLDWLADELVRNDFDLRVIHRIMLTSAAYRQSSAARREAVAVDADNRLLWRRSPARLEAEAVRDAMLATSGALDRRMGGKSYQDFETYFFKGTQFYDAKPEVGPAFARRSLYRMWARGGRNPLLDTLDCPDPSTTTPRRARTTTPLQALALFNNAFVMDQAKELAARIRREAGGEVAAQVRRAYELAYGRRPREDEARAVGEFVGEHGLEALGRVMFNTSEFVRVE